MIPYLSASLFAIVDAAGTPDGRFGWCAMVLSAEGSRITTGQLPTGTKGEAVYAALAEAARLLPPEGEAIVILPSVDSAPFDRVTAFAQAINSRPGNTECYPNGDILGDAASVLDVARSLAQAEACRTKMTS